MICCGKFTKEEPYGMHHLLKNGERFRLNKNVTVKELIILEGFFLAVEGLQSL